MLMVLLKGTISGTDARLHPPKLFLSSAVQLCAVILICHAAGTGRTRLYGLNLSRCLGDKFLKDEDLGLSAQPYVSRVVRLQPNQRAVAIIASDGLWDVADGARALEVALFSQCCESGYDADCRIKRGHRWWLSTQLLQAFAGFL